MDERPRSAVGPEPVPVFAVALAGLVLLVPALGLLRHGVSWDRAGLLRANEMPWAPWPWALLAVSLLVAWHIEVHDGRPRKVVRNVAVVGWMLVVLMSSLRAMRDLGGLTGVVLQCASGLGWAIVLVAAGRESVRALPVRTPHTAWPAGVFLAGHAWLALSLSEHLDGVSALVLPALVLVVLTAALRWRGHLFARGGPIVAALFVACFSALGFLTSTGPSTSEAALDAGGSLAGAVSLVLVGVAYGARRARADQGHAARRAG